MESRANQSSLTLTPFGSPLHSCVTSCTLSGKVSSRPSFCYGLETSKGLMRARRSIKLTPSSGNRLDLKLQHLGKLFLLHLAPIFQTLLTASLTSVLTCGPSGFSLLVLLSFRIVFGIKSTSSTLLTLFPSSTCPVLDGKSLSKSSA